VRDLIGPEDRWVVVDADRPEDLRRVARRWQQQPECVLVGSAGLARHLAQTSAASSRVRSKSDGPLLVVAGSPSPTTHEQLTYLDGLAHVVVMRTPPSDQRDAGAAARALAEEVAVWSVQHRPGALVLTGGATARCVFAQLGATRVRIHGEISPGVPMGEIEDGLWRGLSVVTKAGGFGTPGTLLDVARALGVSCP
jgi:uncharacterized protein YgbK (DUF1537 family)